MYSISLKVQNDNKIRLDKIEMYSFLTKFLCQRLLKNTNNIRMKTIE